MKLRKFPLIFKKSNGQGLLELIVAIGIIIAGVVATLTLVISSIQAGRKSADKIIASNLAREGIEIVRNIRDSNWITTGSNWDDGLISGTDPTAIPIIDNTNATSLDFTPSNFGAVCVVGKPDCTKIYKSDSYYIQRSDPSNLSETYFYRLLYLNPICRNPNDGTEKIVEKGESSTCGLASYVSYTEKIGIRVISEIHWPNPSGKNVVEVEDRLYNWRSSI